jgi:hypothetical protein
MAAVTLLLCVFAVAAIAFYQRSPNLSPLGSVALFAAGYAVYATVAFVAIWFFWQGRNWARWLVIAGSLLALSNLLNFGSWTSMQQKLIVVESVFGAWLLYWLNTKKGRAVLPAWRHGRGGITRRWSGPRRRYTSLAVERRACAAAAAQRPYVIEP